MNVLPRPVMQKVAPGVADAVFGIVKSAFAWSTGPCGTVPVRMARPPAYSTPLIGPRGAVPPLAFTSIRPVPAGMFRLGTHSGEPAATPAKFRLRTLFVPV